jgi:hypothetical protein
MSNSQWNEESTQVMNGLLSKKNFTRRGFLGGLGAGSALLAASGVSLSSVFAQASANQLAPLAAPTSNDLLETGPLQNRWLSLPSSPLVVNPMPGLPAQYSQVFYNAAPQFPLHLGYYDAAGKPANLSDVLDVYQKPAGATGSVQVAWEDTFHTLNPAWQQISALPLTAQIVNNELELVIPTGNPSVFAPIYQQVTINLDQTPLLQITVPQAQGAWSLKLGEDLVNPLNNNTVLHGDAGDEGTFTYNIAEATGWSGLKTFNVIIFVVGFDQPVFFSGIRIVGIKAILETASDFTTSWKPYTLPFTGSYANGTSITGQDFFVDVNTVQRVLQFPVTNSNTQWILAGSFAGNIVWDATHLVLTVSATSYAYAVAFPPVVTGTISFFASSLQLLANVEQLQTPGTTGVWSLDIQAPRQGDLVVSVAFATTGEGGTATAVSRALAAQKRDGKHWSHTLQKQQRDWDRLLASVPQPMNFTLTNPPNDGLPVPSATQVQHMYYVAWVHLLASPIPAFPDLPYPYPQLCTAKAALFPGVGARWDSMLGSQFYVYVNPDLAWQAYKGLMSASVVHPDGSVDLDNSGGENLPSREAQTAWILYAVTGDLASLNAIYATLKRRLLWEEQHPFYDNTNHPLPPTTKSTEFVFSLLIDMLYAQRIADALQMPQESAFWQTERQNFFQQALIWFWATPTSQPSLSYDTQTGQRDTGLYMMIMTGLHVDLLQGSYLTAMLQELAAQEQLNQAFLGLPTAPAPKFPNLSYLIYGLLDQGRLDEAVQVVGSIAQVISNTNFISEGYTTPGGQAAGVTFSLFGVCALVDAIWMMNGYRADQGWPNVVNLNMGNGGIQNLQLRGQRLDLQLSTAEQTVSLAGSFVKKYHITPYVHVAPGQTLPLPTKK